MFRLFSALLPSEDNPYSRPVSMQTVKWEDIQIFKSLPKWMIPKKKKKKKKASRKTNFFSFSVQSKTPY